MFEVVMPPPWRVVNNRVRYNVYKDVFTWYARATTLEAAERIARLLNEDDMAVKE